MRANWFFLLLLLVARPLVAAEPIGDKITVNDGSVLKGEIKRVENGKLILDTNYSNDVAIKVTHIVDLESNQRYSIRLVSGEIVSGYLEVSNGKIILREALPAPDDAEAVKTFGAIDLTDNTHEILPATPTPGAEELVPETSPSAENRLQQTAPGDLQRDNATVEVAEPVDTRSSESLATTTDLDGREFSFDDVDWIREEPSYLRYEADLNIGAQFARGNSDTTDLYFDGLFEPSFGWNTIRISGEYDKKKADGNTTTNRWTASLAYERNIGRYWFIGADNTYESDRQRDLDLRIITAAGIGYRFFDDGSTSLSVLPGIAYVIANFTDDTQDDDYAAFHWILDFSRDLYNDDITFFHNNLYINNLQTLSDIIVETRTGIKFDMPWDLVLSAEFQTDWENEPAEGTKKLDTRYMLKIGLQFEGDEQDWFH